MGVCVGKLVWSETSAQAGADSRLLVHTIGPTTILDKRDDPSAVNAAHKLCPNGS